MPNVLSVEIYIPREVAEEILQNVDATHVLVQGNVIIDPSEGFVWNIEASDFPSLRVKARRTCPNPCT